MVRMGGVGQMAPIWNGGREVSMRQYLAIARRFERAHQDCLKAWETCKASSRWDPDLRARYVALLRRCTRLQAVLKTQSLNF